VWVADKGQQDFLNFATNMKTTNTSHPILVFLVSFTLFLFGCKTTAPKESGLYDGFGNYHRTITTDSKKAQALFDQGMQLMYGFNHDEAIRSFHAAALHDPDAAMPWWAIAYAHGVNINDPAMSDERSQRARDAADTALNLIENATPTETALIQAVSKRYSYPPPENRRQLDEGYAGAMQEVYEAFPNDPEVGTLFGDALMNLQPWDYWNKDGTPKGRTDEIVQVLESTMKGHPNHPGANHFYIHTVEASNNPDRAVPAADRLRTLVPGAGHLVHMPSHIYVRVGRYSDAVSANVDAVEADRHYFKTAPKPEMYAVYFAHNLHFLSYAAMMSGNYKEGLKAARDLEREMPEEPLKAFAGLIEGIMPNNFHVMIRFGKWEEILLEPDYPEYRFVSRAVRRYARSIALSSLGRTAEARAEMEAFDVAMENVPKDWMIFNNSVGKVLPIAKAMVEGELLWREGKVAEAFAKLRFGIQEEDTLVYDEPPGWMIPVRHALGALLMKNGQAEEAERIYLEDLERNRNNGWGLIGLQQAYRAQGKTDLANKVEARIQAAWPDGIRRPSSSCFCEPGATP
jgi:tetratricopeptide (TPR) repeat protein